MAVYSPFSGVLGAGYSDLLTAQPASSIPMGVLAFFCLMVYQSVVLIVLLLATFKEN